MKLKRKAETRALTTVGSAMQRIQLRDGTVKSGEILDFASWSIDPNAITSSGETSKPHNGSPSTDAFWTLALSGTDDADRLT